MTGRRWRRRVGIGLATTALLSFAGAGAGWRWLASPTGERWLQARVVAAANEALEGRLAIGRLELDAPLKLTLDDVSLTAPGDAGPVLGLEQLVVDLDVLALLRGRLHLRGVSLVRPRAGMVFRDGATNLQRALALKHPSPPSREPPPDLPVDAVLSITSARLELEGPTPVHLEDVDLTTTLSGTLRRLHATVEAGGHLSTPAARNLSVVAAATVEPERLAVDNLRLSFGASTLAAQADARPDASVLHLRLQSLHVDADDLNTLVPEAKLLGDVDLHGVVALDHGDARLDLTTRLPRGVLETRATAKLTPDPLAPLGAWTMGTDVRDVDPSAVRGGLPRAALKAVLEVAGEGLPGAGRATLTLDASGSSIEDVPADVARVRAELDGRTIRLREARVSAAGVEARAKGRANEASLDLDARLRIDALARTRAALVGLLGDSLPSLKGSLTAEVKVGGTPKAPTLDARLVVPSLVAGDQSVEGLRGRLVVEQLSPPALHVEKAHVDRVAAAGLSGRDLDFTARLDSRVLSVTLDGTLARPASGDRAPAALPLQLIVSGERLEASKGSQAWALRSLSVTALGASMRSTNTATVFVTPRETSLEGLSLAGDLGTVSASVRAGRHGSIAADVALSGLRFETLPPALVPSSIGLSGTLGGSVAVSGSTGRPHVETHWKLSQARLHGTGPLEASVDASLADGRAQARVQGSLATGGAFDFQASLPAHGPDLSSVEPVAVRFSLDRLGLAGLAGLAPLLPAARDLEGVLTSSVDLSGSWRAPRLASETTWSGLGALGVTGIDGRLTADWNDGRVSVTGEAAGEDAMRLGWSAEAPLSNRILKGVPPMAESWPIQAAVRLEKLDLGWLSQVRPELGPLSGRVAGQLSAGGTLAAPAIDGSLALDGLVAHGYRDVDALVDLHGDDRVEGAVRLRRAGRDLASIRWRIPRSTEALKREFSDWQRIPASLEATLLPTPLALLVPPGTRWPADGDLSANIRFEGSFESPDLHMRSTLDALRIDGDPRGTFTLAADVDAVRAALDARFLSHRAGSLLLSASMPKPLTVIEQPRAAPFEARVTMEGFDLSTLDGLAAGVRGLAGRMDAAVTAGGTIGQPKADGQVRLTHGRFGLVEYGSFDEVAMDLSLDERGAALRDLSGRSGSGSFALSGGARRDGDVVSADVHARLRALPLVQNDQTRGYLTVDVDAGDIVLRDRTLRVPKLVVSKGLLRIPERPQKSVQPLEPHPDIVVAGETPSARPASPPPLTAVVNLVVPDDFKVEAPLGNTLVLGADLEARLDPALAADGKGAFDLAGKMRLPRGSIQLLQARFDLQPTSSVTLYPRQFLDPTLDVSARHESHGVEVTAAFTGTASNPVRRLTAKPEMDESEILYFIATGQRQQRAQTDPFSLSQQTLDDTLVGLVGSIGSSFAKSYLTKYLGKAADLDVLSLDTRGNARVGTYLWHGKLYLGGQVRPNANVLAGENSAELNAEYRIGEHSFGRLRVGDQNRNALELLYQDSVPAKSQRKAGKGR